MNTGGCFEAHNVTRNKDISECIFAWKPVHFIKIKSIKFYPLEN